jgi:uncharacterized protein YneF (UPF0154 family)
MTVLIKILFLVLVVGMVAVVGAVIAGYFRVRRHMNGSSKGSQAANPGLEHESQR